MVWRCGNNGYVPYGLKGVDGGSKWGRIRDRPRLGWIYGVNVPWATEE